NGTSGPVPISTLPVTTINTLTMANTTFASTIDVGSGGTPGILRLGAQGGIFIANIPNVKALTIGTAPNVGTITAGGADNVGGELILGNFASGVDLTINSHIADNGFKD